MKMNHRFLKSDNFYEQGYYICTVDLGQKDKFIIKTENGDVDLVLFNRKNNNHRVSHPNVGTVVEAVGNTDFSAGDTILCHHFTFTDGERKDKFLYESDGVKYYKVTNREVFFKIDGEDLTPRKGVILCEPIFGSIVPPNSKGADRVPHDYRRDVCKVLKPWDNSDDSVVFKDAKYLLLAKGGDYQFDFNKKSYLKVDDYFHDVLAIVGSPDWYDTEVRKHIKDYNGNNLTVK